MPRKPVLWALVEGTKHNVLATFNLRKDAVVYRSRHLGQTRIVKYEPARPKRRGTVDR